MLSFVMLIVGFALLVWGADKFVAGASALARRLGVSPLLVGLTIVAFGTSAPELAVSLTAALQGANEIAVGNVVGSNIFNLLVVAGLSAVVCPLVMDRTLMRRDWPLSLLAAVVLCVMIAPDLTLSRIEGIILLVFFAATLFFQIRSAMQNRNTLEDTGAEAFMPPLLIGVNIVLGLACIIIGGQLAVNGATGIARMFGLSETLIDHRRHRYQPARAGHLTGRRAQGTERDRHGQCHRFQHLQYPADPWPVLGDHAHPGSIHLDHRLPGADWHYSRILHPGASGQNP